MLWSNSLVTVVGALVVGAGCVGPTTASGAGDASEPQDQTALEACLERATAPLAGEPRGLRGFNSAIGRSQRGHTLAAYGSGRAVGLDDLVIAGDARGQLESYPGRSATARRGEPDPDAAASTEVFASLQKCSALAPDTEPTRGPR